MQYYIRRMEPDEFPLLQDFLYEAVFQRDPAHPLPRSILTEPALRVYIENFGEGADDYCLCALADKKIVGAVWVRSIDGYGHLEDGVPEFAISLYKEYRGQGLGSALMRRMLEHLKSAGYKGASLAVQKDNPALKLYLSVGFHIVEENAEEYIMLHPLNAAPEADGPKKKPNPKCAPPACK